MPGSEGESPGVKMWDNVVGMDTMKVERIDLLEVDIVLIIPTTIVSISNMGSNISSIEIPPPTKISNSFNHTKIFPPPKSNIEEKGRAR